MKRAWSANAEQTLRELYAVLSMPELCFRLKRTDKAIKSRAKLLGLRRSDRRPWTAAEKRILRRRYPHERSDAIAADLGRPVSTVYQKAVSLGLRKSAAYLATKEASRFNGHEPGSVVNRFKPGQTPPNKGLRRPGYAPGRMAQTQFKKGQKPHTWKPIGSERINAAGYRDRKITDTGYPSADWKGVHVLLWEEHLGPVPKGFAVVFKNRNKADIRIDNLALLSRAELMRRNTLHRYPKEIAQLIQLRGALNRQINRRTRDGGRHQHPAQ